MVSGFIYIYIYRERERERERDIQGRGVLIKQGGMELKGFMLVA